MLFGLIPQHMATAREFVTVKIKDMWVENQQLERISISISSDGQFVSGDFYYVKLLAIGFWK